MPSNNAFNKEEIVAFENLLEGFQDGLVISKAANIYQTDSSACMLFSNDSTFY